jgi:uncharacterized protein DUF5958
MNANILLNQLAQGALPIADGEEWFRQQDANARRDILRMLYYFVMQSDAVEVDVAEAIERSGLRATFTPCVLLAKGRLMHQVSKIVNLPASEQAKSFRLLVSLLGVSDRRRRVKCGEGCAHWWHRDLSNSSVLEEVEKELEGK